MKQLSLVVAITILGLPLEGLAAQPEAAPPAAAAPESAPPPSADPAATEAAPPAAAEAPTEAAGEEDPASTWEDPPAEPEAVAAPTPPPVSAPPPKRQDSIKARIKANPELLRRYRTSKKWAIGGGVAGGVGLIIGISGAYVAVLASDAADDDPSGISRDALTSGLVMAGIGGTLLAAGAAVLAVGLVKRKNVLEEAETYPPVAVTPWYGGDSGGLSFSGRF